MPVYSTFIFLWLIMKLNLLFLVLASIINLTCSTITLPTIFQNGLVLQQEPLKAHIHGYTTSNKSLSIHLICKDGHNQIANANINYRTFSAYLDPVKGGSRCTIMYYQDEETKKLEDIIFGDVWICSGQSNMKRMIYKLKHKGAEEITASANYTNIRMFEVEQFAHIRPQKELSRSSSNYTQNWFDVSNQQQFLRFSAVCYLTANQMTDLSKNRLMHIGLIASTWGGTSIEAWSPLAVLRECGLNLNQSTTLTETNKMYNSMIHPLTKFTIKGVLWYQGEKNSWYHKYSYNCTFPSMIKHWRNTWSYRSQSDANFPFGFVQLAPREISNNYEFSVERWLQTANYGYTPNKILQNVFMAVAIDTFDQKRGVHPQDKKIVAYRLAVAAMRQAYGNEQYPLRGPRPYLIFVYHKKLKATKVYGVKITFADGNFKYNATESSGFYVCLLESDSVCDETEGSWLLINRAKVYQLAHNVLDIQVPYKTSAVAYLWNESPVIRNRAAPIYSDDQFGLPAAPFKFSLKLGHSIMP